MTARTQRQIQRDHYAETASSYDEHFVHEGDEHFVALGFISALIAGNGYGSVLDVGAGTGRAIAYLLDRHDDLELRGVEPVRMLIDQAEVANGVPEGLIVEGSGEALPFDDDS